MGAVYLDGGYEAVRRVVLPWVQTQRLTQDAQDYKSALQEFLQQRGPAVPEYEIIQTVGPEHDKTFTVRVSLNGNELGTGKGHNRKQAEQAAAHSALEKLKS